MSINWESFVKRRNLNISRFLTLNEIKTRIEFLAHLTKIGVEPPSEETINGIFPPPPPVMEKAENQSPPEPELLRNVSVVTRPYQEKPAKQKSNVNVKK